jgi:ABC-type nitrate/sulfonate/bicarbonate transport system substrate-binding protein
MNALGTGDLDYAVTLAQGVSAAIQGVPVKLVMMTQDKLTFFLLGRPEIKNVTDLKGKIIGISYPGSTTHLVATMMLRNFGLQEDKDFKMLPSGDEQGRLAALEAKRVHASIVSPPTDYFGEKMGFKILLRASDQIKIPQNAVIVRDKKIQESRDQLKRMMKGTIEALQYIQTHKHEVTDIAAKWVGRDRESVGREINGYWSAYSSDGTMRDDVLRETINIGLQRAKLEKTIPISQVADTTILNEVKREMGIR